MKTKLISLALFFCGIISHAQNSENLEPIEFLNFNMTKNLTDYGFSKMSLEKDLTPIDLEYLKRYNSHFLSSFEFDKEVGVFRKSGFIAFILLEKQFKGGSEKHAWQFFEEVKTEIISKYGSTFKSEERFAEWFSPAYHISLNIQSDNSVIVAYNNLLLSDLENSDGYNSDKNNRATTYHQQKDHQNRTKRLEDFLNEFLQAYEQIDVRSFARLNGEAMEIYFERNNDITPSYEDRGMQEEIKKLELKSLKDLTLHVISNTCNTKEDLETLSKTTIDKIRFIQDIYYKDGTESHHKITIYKDDILNLRTPIRKKEVLDIIN